MLRVQEWQIEMCTLIILHTLPWFYHHLKALLFQILAGNSSVETDHSCHLSLDSTALVSSIFHLKRHLDVLSYWQIVREFKRELHVLGWKSINCKVFAAAKFVSHLDSSTLLRRT